MEEFIYERGNTGNAFTNYGFYMFPTRWQANYIHNVYFIRYLEATKNYQFN